MLTTEEVKKIATLARIELTEDEVLQFQKDLSLVLDYVSELQKLETDGVEEVSQVTGLVNVQRDDSAERFGSLADITAGAPETKDGYYKVKAIL